MDYYHSNISYIGLLYVKVYNIRDIISVFEEVAFSEPYTAYRND